MHRGIVVSRRVDHMGDMPAAEDGRGRGRQQQPGRRKKEAGKAGAMARGTDRGARPRRNGKRRGAFVGTIVVVVVVGVCRVLLAQVRAQAVAEFVEGRKARRVVFGLESCPDGFHLSLHGCGRHLEQSGT